MPSQELEAREHVARLQAEVDSLTVLLEAGAASSLAEDAEVEELIRQKEECAAQRDGLAATVSDLRVQLDRASGRMQATEAERAAAEQALAALQQMAGASKGDAERESRRRERVERELKEVRLMLDARCAELRERKASAQAAGDHLERLQATLQHTQAANDRLHKEKNANAEATSKLRKDYEAQVAANAQVCEGWLVVGCKCGGWMDRSAGTVACLLHEVSRLATRERACLRCSARAS